MSDAVSETPAQEVMRAVEGGESERPDFPLCSRCGAPHVKWTGARWLPTCTSHAKVWVNDIEQVGQRRPCENYPIGGMPVCGVHGAGGREHKELGRRRLALAAAMEEVQHVGGQLDVDPAEAMLTMVRECAWNVALYRELVQRLSLGPDEPPDELEGDSWSDAVRAVVADWKLASIVGRLSPQDWRTGPHALLKLYDDERERLMKYAKMCRDAGVDERMTRVAEQAGALLVRAVDVLIGELDLTPAQQARVGPAMGRVIEVFESS